MSKILIEGNKVIIDGHTNDLETCNTLTNLCDELSTSEKFRTVKYESGYGEFESVSENEEKKFAPSRTFEIYSNDGSLRLAVHDLKVTDITSVVEDGVIVSNTIRIYTYSGDKIFKGLTLTQGSSNIDFPVGSDKSFNDLGGDIYYIVEEDPPGHQVNIYSNDGTATLVQNATVDSVVVTAAGAQLKCGDAVKATYDYSGSKLFAGLATSANAIIAEYKPGDTIKITAETTLYIVENIIIPEHHSSLNELFTNIAAVIREKTGMTDSIAAAEFPSMIRSSLQVIPPREDCLTFSSPSSFTLAVNDASKHWDGTLEYSTDASTWSTWDGTTTLSSAASGSKNTLYLRGIGNTVITGMGSNYKWVLTGSSISCVGNIENLLDYATVESGNHPTMNSNCYYSMFQGCTSLTQVPALPATTLANYCYSSMFYGCTSLTQAPALPATTLAEYCYSNMFYGCTSLTQVPALLATTLAGGCYQNMFRGCTSLTQAPELPATTLAGDCYNSMFSGCTSLTQVPALPATTLANYCYSSMFYDCTSLTQAPALPATTLAIDCYYSMFSGCTSLTQVPALPATTLADDCYQNMFYGCTSLTQVPALPATTLTKYCYRSMFESCTKIKISSKKTGEYTVTYRVPTTGTGTTATDALSSMFSFTGGDFRNTPSINTTYYLSNTNQVISPPITLINFTIDGTSYQAEEGMTWGEWVNSEYNTYDFYIGDLSKVYTSNKSGYDVRLNNYIEYSTYIIQNNTLYELSKGVPEKS